MLDPDADTWRVDLAGRAVLMFTIDYRVTLHLYGEADYDGMIILQTPFQVSLSGDPVRIDPKRKDELVCVF